MSGTRRRAKRLSSLDSLGAVVDHTVSATGRQTLDAVAGTAAATTTTTTRSRVVLRASAAASHCIKRLNEPSSLNSTSRTSPTPSVSQSFSQLVGWTVDSSSRINYCIRETCASSAAAAGRPPMMENELDTPPIRGAARSSQLKNEECCRRIAERRWHALPASVPTVDETFRPPSSPSVTVAYMMRSRRCQGRGTVSLAAGPPTERHAVASHRVGAIMARGRQRRHNVMKSDCRRRPLGLTFSLSLFDAT